MKRLTGEGDSAGAALVRPLAVATCDLDAAMVSGAAPLPGPFAFGHEFVAEVAEVAHGRSAGQDAQPDGRADERHREDELVHVAPRHPIRRQAAGDHRAQVQREREPVEPDSDQAEQHTAVGESSPSYLHGPVARRIKAQLPDVKLVAILGLVLAVVGGGGMTLLGRSEADATPYPARQASSPTFVGV